jgi:ubiquitin-like protein ATG12
MDSAATSYHTSFEEDTTSSTTPKNDAAKVKIHFVAVGSAPILKRHKFQISADQRFAAVHIFLRKLLKLPDPQGAGDAMSSPVPNLFLYCHSAFCPAPDQLLGELRDVFAVRDELVIHYSLQEAWG